MRQNVSVVPAALLLVGLLGCGKSPGAAHTMSDAERERAKAVAGWWTSTQDDVGFSANLKPDGTGVLVCGKPLETIKGPWWVASSPERLVIQRSNGTLVQFQIVQLDDESMKLRAIADGKQYLLRKALVISPK